uniref:tRNA-specific adenosine deaminase n=1 Tax=uncultured bacterium 12AC_lac13 TaxID=1447233 RepID=X2L7F2_9BACT|nr:zinc-binding CMP/dCMP deaminase [uncultured bacterium 12AC_lac13]
MKEQDDEMAALALAEAKAAGERGEVPIGAVLVSGEGRVLAKNGNRILELKDPTAHAEILVLRESARVLGNERLVGTTLYVTLESCAMCAGAISLARVARVVYAAADPKGGAIEHGPRFFAQPTCHHRPVVDRAGDAEAAGRLLQDFFRARRV